MRRGSSALLAMLIATLAVLAAATSAVAAPAAVLAATYSATVPPTGGAGTTMVVPVTLRNTGDEPWTTTGPGLVNLSYHWYAADGSVVVWEGLRTGLGTPVMPGATAQVNAAVMLPATAGSYQLRFHLVREGVAWFPQPSAPFAVQATTAYAVRFGAVPAVTALSGSTFVLSVPVTNTGSAAWNATGANPITLSYHWHDAAGNTVVWDGIRTALPQDVAPGAAATIQARITAPDRSGALRLTLDLVREGVSWFQFLGGTPLAVPATIESARWSGGYAAPATVSAGQGETKTIPVTVTNTGNVAWSATGPNPVNIGYHLFDSAGRTVVWDGTRTPIGADLAPGQSRAINLTFTAPAQVGEYSLNVEAVREGITWFSGYGVPASSTRLTVTTGYNAGYGATTTPAQVSMGAEVDLTVAVTNYGPRALVPGTVALSYHLHNSSGATVVWDGLRGTLPRQINAGETVSVPIRVRFPSAIGSYTISWDLVQEGVAWFSQIGVPVKSEAFSVVPGVTFYGKGFGHGVGMSQHGAQALATGAGGRAPLTGEQIIQHYYRGTQITPINMSGENAGIRVLLSVPSSTGIYTCGSPAMNVALTDVVSAGGFRVLNEGVANAQVGLAQPNEPWQIFATGGVVQVWRNTGTPTKVYEGAGPVVLVPSSATVPITIQQKGSYRGTLRFTNTGDRLRVINYVNYDDYAKGVIRKEMFGGWHHEAYKAQSYAAKAYGFTSYKGGSSDYDARDDQLDQCYGGTAFEEPATNAAVEATRGRIPTYNGEVIRAFFSSSSGGVTVSEGCWGPRLQRSGSSWVCGASRPYLVSVPDPADLALTSPAPNRHASWQVTFTGAQIRAAVLSMNGVDIGTLQSIGLDNRSPADVGHVVSVVVRGTLATVDLQADVFFRTHLRMKSTLVRLAPF